MAQAEYLNSAISALVPGASTRPSSTPVRTAYAEFITDLAANPPWPIPICSDATHLQDRATHADRVLAALSAYLTALLEDAAENIPGGLDLRQIDAFLFDLASEVRGTFQDAIDRTAWRMA
jgi:hypothetical protein